jgi:hypothetical protein
MTLLEMHYTSAEHGLGGSPGFQFVQLSADVDPGICRQVESLLAYEPPRTAPSQPTPAQIADFPIALSHTLLTGGAAVLCRATYTGTDYSGRFGNFYAHALYLPGGPGDLGPVLPIDTWASASWRTVPPTAAIPAASRMEPGEAITRETLLAFTKQRHDQLAAVLTDIMNSFGRRGPQVILAEGQSDPVPAPAPGTAANLHHLHAAAVSVLPPDHRHHPRRRLLVYPHRAHRAVPGVRRAGAIQSLGRADAVGSDRGSDLAGRQAGTVR